MLPIHPNYRVVTGKQDGQVRIALYDGEVEKCTVLIGYPQLQADTICAHLNLAVEHGAYAKEQSSGKYKSKRMLDRQLDSIDANLRELGEKLKHIRLNPRLLGE